MVSVILYAYAKTCDCKYSSSEKCSFGHGNGVRVNLKVTQFGPSSGLINRVSILL